MQISKHHKIWAVSLVLLIVTVQGAWWLLPENLNRAFYFVLGAYYLGLLWGDITIWIERRYADR